MAADPASTETAALAAVSDLRTADVFGTSIRYHDIGSGPLIVLVHGLGSSSDGDWGRVMPELAKTHRVLALDLLGFGKSDKPLIDYSIQTWVDVLGEFLRLQSVGDDFTLMGESLGGWISAKYTSQALLGVSAAGPALALPRPSRLVLSDSAGRRETMQRATSSQHPMFSAPASSLAAERELLGAVFSDPSWQTPEALKAGMAWSMAKGDAWTIRSFQDPRIVREALTDADLKAITIPTLVVWGEHDKLIPIADGRWLASRVRGAQFRIVNGSGHAPMIEKPTAFLEAVAGFVQ